eukprot:COSAG01_NODE_598_length_15018_cov_60.164488_7_plen_74_part_00
MHMVRGAVRVAGCGAVARGRGAWGRAGRRRVALLVAAGWGSIQPASLAQPVLLPGSGCVATVLSTHSQPSIGC